MYKKINYFTQFLLFVFATNSAAMETAPHLIKDIKDRVKIIFFENRYIKDLTMLIKDNSGADITDMVHADYHEVCKESNFAGSGMQCIKLNKNESISLLLFNDEETKTHANFPLQVDLVIPPRGPVSTELLLSFAINEEDDRKKIIFKDFDYRSGIGDTQTFFYKGLAAFVKDKDKEIERAKINSIFKAERVYPNSSIE